MNNFKKVSLYILLIFFLAAGINHFISPSSYIKIIPPYFPFRPVINLLSGFFELLCALLLISTKTRPYGAWGIVLLMIAFIPVHVQMVEDAPFVLGGTWTVTPLIAWIRLVILQPFLILWAWWYTKASPV